jgi:hypothetical protein
MKMKSLLLVLVALGIAFAGLSVEDFSLTKDVYAPGDQGVATVTVSNPLGSERVSSITMSIDNPPEIQVTSASKMSDIDAGGSAIVSIPFRVKDTAKPGIYLFNVVFTGYKSSGGTSLVSVNTVSIPVMVENEPDLSFSVDNKVLSGIDDIMLTISNNGGNAKNVKIGIPSSVVNSTASGSSASIALFGTDQIYMPIVEAGKNVTVQVTLDSRSAADGATSLPLYYQYDDELGVTSTSYTSLRVTVRNEGQDLLFSQQSDIITKKEGELVLSVSNDGTETLRDVRLSFADASVKLKNSNELKFGDIQPGGSATATGTVFADLPPGVNLVASELSWIERDVQKTGTSSIPLTITSDADVGVYLEAKPLPLTTGMEHTISVLVSNLGSYGIGNVDVRLESSALRSLDISDSQYIGGLQNDDFSTVQFQMKVNATSAGDYPVDIVVNYRDQSGEWKQRVLTQSISVYGPQAAEDSPMPILFGVLILAVAVWYFRFRKA